MPSQLIQQRNIEMVRLLAADLQPRYEPNFAWCNAVAAMKALPGIRGLWAMSAYDSGGQCRDLSDNVLTLSVAGEPGPLYGYEALIPYVDMNGQSDYLTRADEADLDIVGNEAFVTAAAQGLSIGGWFKPTNVTQNGVGLMGKWDTNGVNERSYILKQALTSAQFIITTDGSTQLTVTSGPYLAANTWSFIAGTFDPSTRRAVFVDGVWATNAVGNPATLHSGTANFEIGSFNAAARGYYDGLASLCFLTTTFLSDTIIESIYAQTRAMFGR